MQCICLAYLWEVWEWASGVGVGEGKAQCINICMRVGVCVRFVGIAGADTVGLVFEAHFSRSLEAAGAR